MKHSLPECMMPDGAEPCQGYTELRKEFLALDSAARIAGDTHASQRADLEQRIEELKSQLEQWREWGQFTEDNFLKMTAADFAGMAMKLRKARGDVQDT